MTTFPTDLGRSYLAQAVELAMRGRGRVEPNPMVGCIIVKEGKIIGRGHHAYFGGPHAERAALAQCQGETAGKLTGELAGKLTGATAYVTLEPCCHSGKKTPPCVPALIAAGISRVVVGQVDPNPLVSGRGIEQLRAAGILVDLANDPASLQLLAPFVARVVHRRPYVTIKWAQSADGKIAGAGGQGTRISNARSHRAIHDLRGRCDAILVGIGTALADDPLLTARGVESPRPLTRIVLDSNLRLPANGRLAQNATDGRLVIFCSEKHFEHASRQALDGVKIIPARSASPGRLDLDEVYTAIASMGVTHLLIEPGATLGRAILDRAAPDRAAPDGAAPDRAPCDRAAWDRAWVFQSPKIIGAADAPDAPPFPTNPIASIDLDGDTLTECLNPAGVYGGPFPSADFLLVHG